MMVKFVTKASNTPYNLRDIIYDGNRFITVGITEQSVFPLIRIIRTLEYSTVQQPVHRTLLTSKFLNILIISISVSASVFSTIL